MFIAISLVLEVVEKKTVYCYRGNQSRKQPKNIDILTSKYVPQSNL